MHGTLNEAGNFLIEVSNEQVGSDISKELKKLNTRWAKFIKRTQFVSNRSSVYFHGIILLCRFQKHSCIFNSIIIGCYLQINNLSYNSVLSILERVKQAIHTGSQL